VFKVFLIGTEEVICRLLISVITVLEFLGQYITCQFLGCVSRIYILGVLKPIKDLSMLLVDKHFVIINKLNLLVTAII